jgi:hypothetical protein
VRKCRAGKKIADHGQREGAGSHLKFLSVLFAAR